MCTHYLSFKEFSVLTNTSLHVTVKFFHRTIDPLLVILSTNKFSDTQRGAFVRKLLMCFEVTAVGLKLPEDGANKRQNV
jgi:hypothetical protein